MTCLLGKYEAGLFLFPKLDMQWTDDVQSTPKDFDVAIPTGRRSMVRARQFWNRSSTIMRMAERFKAYQPLLIVLHQATCSMEVQISETLSTYHSIPLPKIDSGNVLLDTLPSAKRRTREQLAI